MIIKRKDTVVSGWAQGKVWDYPMPDDQIGFSYQEYNGRVPEKGWGINTVCWEAYYVISGRAEVFVDNEHKTVESGDVVILQSGQKSYIIAEYLKLLTITKPDWYPEQYKEI